MSSLVIILFVIIIFLIIIGVTVYIVKNGNNYFENNKVYGTAIIIGYATNSTSSNVKYMVKVLNSGDDNQYNLKGVYNVKSIDGSLNSEYPHFSIGDRVEVEYAKRKIAGIDLLDVRIRRELYDYPN